MAEIAVAGRYAKSLLDLSFERGVLEEVRKDILLILDVLNNNKDLIVMLKSPVIKTDKKLTIVNGIFKGKISDLTLAFINIITSKKREKYTHGICQEFENIYRNQKNILKAVVISAIGLDSTLRKEVLELVKGSEKKEIELLEKVDKNLIGGFILRIGDKQVDQSILRQVKNLRKSFSENPYIKKL